MNLEDKLEDFKLTFFGKNFIWRKGQKEAIIEIINAYNNKTKVVILDAPVGSGKSIIALAVAWILNLKGAQGYILASDISLQEQYEKDLEKGNFNWGSVKGINNYLCIDNMEKNSLGTCRIRGVKAQRMHCYRNCPYFSARDNAMESTTAILNYAYWLIMMNYVNQHLDEALFPPRDFTICDEAHKILDIIQSHYSPKIDPKTLEKIEKLTNFFTLYKIKNHSKDYSDIKQYFSQLLITENQDQLYEILLSIEDSLNEYTSSFNILKDKVKKDYPKEEPPKEWREILRFCDQIKDLHCKIEDYNDIINKTSTRNIVKNPNGEKELIFNCLEESYMMHKYFYEWTGFTILMSATFADPTKYMKSIALNSAKYIKVENSFSFEKSPIYYYNKRRMSFKNIDANLPWLYKTINSILDKHQKDNGIIHTGSYDLAMKIYENINSKYRSRILIYNGTEEKHQVLEILKRDKSKVLMGPSLTTGLDLKDDWSRFMIIAKIPYASLSNKFIEAKLKISSEWYNWKTIIEILQSVGRSVRNEDDWCIGYILDACLSDLLHNNRKAFPLEFINRLQIINND